MLLDLYGGLLTKKQQRFTKMHFEDDLSFGEIAREFGVSRQAVYDAVKHAEESLERYEQKLGLLKRSFTHSSNSCGRENEGALKHLIRLKLDISNHTTINDPYWVVHKIDDVIAQLKDTKDV